MNREDMEKVQRYFEAALAIPAGQREQYLAELHSKDAALCNEIKALLNADSESKIWDSNSLIATVKQPRESLQAAETVGPYRIIEQIGVGGMGVIYKASDTRLDRHVALKFLPVNLHSDAHIRQRFLAEARTASQLDHPNICIIYDVGETQDGHLYIAMPCYEGETLAKRIGRGPLSRRDALDIALKIAEGLASAHAHEIVHRDIKPENIMLTHDGGVKILDFGIAKVADIHLTQTGVSIGTLAYMSPEQLRGEAVDARTDIWSLGVVLYELLTGSKAFPARALPEILQSVLDDNGIPQSLSTSLPKSLYRVLHQSIARDLTQRYDSMVSMHQALFEARESLDGNGSGLQAVQTVSQFSQAAETGRKGRYVWDEGLLARITDILTPLLGPIAPVLVQRKAKIAADIKELFEELADALPNQSSREAFERQIEKEASSFTSPPVPQTVKTDGELYGVELSATQLAAIEAELISHIGPITQTLIRRHAVNASSLPQLFDTLSQHLNNTNDRKIFVQKMHKLFTIDE